MGRGESTHRFSAAQGHPWVAVDLVVLTLSEAVLRALLVQVKDRPFAGKWAFPGGLVGAEESLDQAAERELRERTGVRDAHVEQLYTFGKPERDPKNRVVSVSYLALVPFQGDMLDPASKYADIGWFRAEGLPRLAYDHDQVAGLALARLRAKLQYTNIVYNLLPPEFTLGELQEAYETILQRPLDRRNFRKRILSLGLLMRLKRKRRGTHRPAALYAFIRRQPMIIEML